MKYIIGIKMINVKNNNIVLDFFHRFSYEKDYMENKENRRFEIQVFDCLEETIEYCNELVKIYGEQINTNNLFSGQSRVDKKIIAYPIDLNSEKCLFVIDEEETEAFRKSKPFKDYTENTMILKMKRD